MTTTFSTTNYTHLLRHSLQLFVLLTFSTFVHSLYVLDIANGRQFPLSVGRYNSGYNKLNFKENREPGSFWWKSKRSPPSSSSLSQEAVHAKNSLPLQKLPNVRYSMQPYRPKIPQRYNGNVALDSDFPRFRASAEGRRVSSAKKMLKKMRQLAAIREALRHRDKLLKFEAHSKEIQNLATATDELLNGDKFHNNMKSRRAKMMAANGRLGQDMSHDSSIRNFDKFNAGSFVDGFAPFESRVEMFPKPSSSKSIGFFNSDPGFAPFESKPLPVTMLAGSNTRSGISGGFGEPRMSGSYVPFNSPPSQGTSDQFGEFVMFPESGTLSGSSSFGSFSEPGAFLDDSKDCPTITSKTCASDLDCSCNGFYTCVRGQCSLRQTLLQGEKSDPPGGIWHDHPVEFGFSKRSHGNDGDKTRIKADQNEAGE